MGEIIQFRKKKPLDVRTYIDFDKGWKFTENDKDFLIKYYEEYLEIVNKDFCGDGSEEIQEILDSIKENGVNGSKELIQEDALIAAGAFGYDIYKKYSDSPDILNLIENSILDVQW